MWLELSLEDAFVVFLAAAASAGSSTWYPVDGAGVVVSVEDCPLVAVVVRVVSAFAEAATWASFSPSTFAYSLVSAAASSLVAAAAVNTTRPVPFLELFKLGAVDAVLAPLLALVVWATHSWRR